MEKKIIRTVKTVKPAAKATTPTPTNITTAEDFAAMVRDQYNASNEKSITKGEVVAVVKAIADSFTKFATSTDADKATCVLPGIGRFTVFEKKSYEATNPKTKEKIVVPAKKRVSFKVFPAVVKTINE